jgi:hypothetical protein
MEAAEDAFALWDSRERHSWETPVDVIAANIPMMTPRTRQSLIRMLEARLAGYTPENIEAAHEKIRC